MRPYLGILRDSFHEAFASRVLWILLVLTTIALLLFAPLGTSEQAAWFLDNDDVLDREGLIRKLLTDSTSTNPTPGQRIWEQLGDDLKSKLASAGKEKDNRGSLRSANDQLCEELNELLAKQDFYNAAAWERVRLTREARDLLAKGLDKIPADQLARFNRLALEAAYPDELVASGRKQLRISYFGWELGDPLPMSAQEFRPFLNQAILFFMQYVPGVFGILAAVIVTASIIPYTFEPGAIDLLLSKPVSRSLVFLTKFLGGCAFTLINMAYLIVGLWLIVGWRYGIWNHKLLLCIPLFMFLFGIYYSVSALAGVIWRNAIVSVVMTIIMWGVCWIIGLAEAGADFVWINPTRIVKVVPAGQALLAKNERGDVLRWAAESQAWEPVFAPIPSRGRQLPFGMLLPTVGPTYDAQGGRLLAVNQFVPQFAMLNTNTLWVGRADDNWRRGEGVAAPHGTEALFIGPQGEIVAVAPGGVHRLQGNPEDKPQSTKVFGFDIPMPGSGSKFEESSPRLRLNTPLSAAMHPKSSDLAVYDGKQLLRLEREESGMYRLAQEVQFEESQPGVLGFGGDTLLLALKDGKVRIYNAATLVESASFAAGKESAPRFVASSPGGRWFSVLFHDRRLWLYDAQTQQPAPPRISGQGDVSAALFTSDDHLLVADWLTRVTDYHLPDWKVESRRQPGLRTVERVYHYGIHPLYTVFPKPSALDNMVWYLLSDDSTVAAGPRGESDLTGTRFKIDVWGPIWSNLAFMSVVLAIGCFYVSRKDF